MDVIEQTELDLLSAYREIDGHADKDKILTAFMSGLLSYEAAASALGVGPGELFEYTKAALTTYEDRDLLHASSSDLIDVLRGSVVQIRRHAKEWMRMPTHAGNVKPIIAMSAELRQLIKGIIELEKTIKESDRIGLQNMEMYLNSISGFLTTELCEECQAKAISFLSKRGTREAKDAEYSVLDDEEFDPNG